MSLSSWLERLYDLRRDKSRGGEKPYKPALLLCLLDLLDAVGHNCFQIPHEHRETEIAGDVASGLPRVI